MTVFIGADHGGLQLKNDLIDYLHEKNIRVEDLGAYELDPLDDYSEIAKKVAQAVLQNPEHMGVVICRSGAGVDITANRFKGIRSVLGFDEHQVQKAREDDFVNVLSLAAEFISVEKAHLLVDSFLNSTPKTDEKYKRRLEIIDSIT
jgi:ribose 5-phosphate isomerase B